MKKHLLLFLLALFTAAIPGFAAEKTIDLTGKTGTASTITDAPFSVSFAKNSAGTAPTFYSDGVRIYYNATKGGSITITNNDNKKITNIVLTYTSSSYAFPTSAPDSGTLTNSGTTGTWTASSDVTSVTFTNTQNDNKQVRIAKLVVTYEDSTSGGGGTTEPEPEPDPEEPDGPVYAKTITLNASNFKASGNSYAKYTYTAEGISFTSVFALTNSTMQFNTNNNNGKASAIVVTATNPDYLIESIDITFGTSGNGVKIYSYSKAFGDLTLAQTPVIPDDALQIESALKADKKGIEVNAPAFAIYPAGSGVIQVSNVTVNLVAAQGGGDEPVDPETPVELTKFAFSALAATWDLNTTVSNPTLPVLEIEPADADITVTYTSSDTAVATVEADGTVKPLAVGETTITAKFDGNDQYKANEATYTLTVKDTTGATEPTPGEESTTEVFETSSLGAANIQPLNDITIGKVTFSFAKAGGSNEPGYFGNGNDIRLYAKNTMTVTAAEGYKVDKIVYTMSNVAQLATLTPSQGEIAQEGETGTWTGAASNFTLTVGEKADLGSDTNKAGQFRFSKIEVTYSKGEGEGGGDEPVEPDPEVTVYTVKEALEMINGGNIPTDKVQVKGLVSAIDEISVQYGNATYDIKDALTDEAALKVFRGKWLEGANFTGTEIKIGGTVVVEGTLTLYDNKTPEVNTGNVVISYDPSTETVVDPNPGEGGEEPTPGEEATATYVPSTMGYSNSQVITEASVGNVTFAFSKGSGNNDPAYYTTGSALRLYGGNTMTITVPEGSEITKIEINMAAGNSSKPYTVNTGNVETSNNTATWTGSAPSVTFTTESGSGHNRVTSINVTYVGGEAPAVAAPVINCVDNMVSITCATDDAKIYYTLDETEPSKDSTPYTEAFPITETTTVKAIAYVDADASAVTTYTATYVGNYAGFEAFVAEGEGTEGTVDGPITAVYQNGLYLYVVDNSNYPMLVYGNVNNTLKNGDKIASITGKYSPYSNLPELTNPVLGEVTKGGTPVEPVVVTASDVDNKMVNMYVELDNMTLATTDDDNKNYTIEDESGSIALYSRFTGVTIPNDVNKTYTVRGFVSIYGTTIQLYPTEFIEVGDVMETVEAPVFNPAGGAVKAGTKVTITSATDEADIYFTTDGTEPTVESELYTEPIEVLVGMTIKAIAVKDGMKNSAVSTATYTIIDPSITSATFDFTDEEWLTGLGINLPTDASTGTDIAGNEYTKESATISFPENTASNKARIWRQTANSGGGVQLRVFAGDNFTISVLSGKHINSIKFDCDATYMNFDASVGTLTTDGTWTSPAIGDDSQQAVTTVTFTPSKASRINSIEVNFAEDGAGVDSVVIDENATIEYYTIQGVRVDNPAAGNLYIVRQGSKVSKVIVR